MDQCRGPISTGACPRLCRFDIGELDEWVPGLRLADDASFFDLPPWTPEVRVPPRPVRK
ncbi:MAG TPA: hypothetical protein VLV54_07895 [Thermoanaerobaculia bacterium]|nr:hypothetical protein [Thermoanaerobaculia bacterium]